MTDHARDVLAESQDEWLTVRDVARLLSVSTWQVRKWLKYKQFDKVMNPGKKLTRISRASYNRFVAKNRQASG